MHNDPRGVDAVGSNYACLAYSSLGWTPSGSITSCGSASVLRSVAVGVSIFHKCLYLGVNGSFLSKPSTCFAYPFAAGTYTLRVTYAPATRSLSASLLNPADAPIIGAAVAWTLNSDIASAVGAPTAIFSVGGASGYYSTSLTLTKLLFSSASGSIAFLSGSGGGGLPSSTPDRGYTPYTPTVASAGVIAGVIAGLVLSSVGILCMLLGIRAARRRRLQVLAHLSTQPAAVAPPGLSTGTIWLLQPRSFVVPSGAATAPAVATAAAPQPTAALAPASSFRPPSSLPQSKPPPPPPKRGGIAAAAPAKLVAAPAALPAAVPAAEPAAEPSALPAAVPAELSATVPVTVPTADGELSSSSEEEIAAPRPDAAAANAAPPDAVAKRQRREERRARRLAAKHKRSIKMRHVNADDFNEAKVSVSFAPVRSRSSADLEATEVAISAAHALNG